MKIILILKEQQLLMTNKKLILPVKKITKMIKIH